ncbi:hypothetical protein VFPBJ_06921 [Purpureocillium lilacinum]|uniref:Uncharacterized protein n=1 Tax=Purpureocillium lilacinum TaxID=33203 RepID=A0A179GN47_PURLI|nr:hypothetical protein VFPBJ_06921 [Purpureocillium lilacinum]
MAQEGEIGPEWKGAMQRFGWRESAWCSRGPGDFARLYLAAPQCVRMSVAPLWPLVPERPPSVILDSRSGLLLYHHPPSFPSRPPSCTRVAYLKPVCPPPRRAPAETR